MAGSAAANVQTGQPNANLESAFNLCSAQSTLEPDLVMTLVEERLSRPHDPNLDLYTKEQLVDMVRYNAAQQFAYELATHPEVLAFLAQQQFVSYDAWQLGWIAFNSWCRPKLTSACILDEIQASEAIRAANTAGQGPTPAYTACMLALSPGMFAPTPEADPVTTKHCMEEIETHKPGKKQIAGCDLMSDVHTRTDPIRTARKIFECSQRDQ
ncbi:MAG: hypothetical protein JO122_08790 [Acetobacteraceae bacterium]|nr:hypothetical protein [Acetobacteraceae bacterium]